MLRIPSPLSDEVEALVHDTIGCCIAVHRALGPGLLENIYSRAVCLEFSAAGISFEREKAYPVMYRGELLSEQRLDFVVGGHRSGNQVDRAVGRCSSLAAVELYARVTTACWPAHEFQCRGAAGWDGEKGFVV